MAEASDIIAALSEMQDEAQRLILLPESGIPDFGDGITMHVNELHSPASFLFLFLHKILTQISCHIFL